MFDNVRLKCCLVFVGDGWVFDSVWLKYCLVLVGDGDGWMMDQ